MRTPIATAVLLSMLAAVCGCGGSGSSGFDVTPFSENALIETVLDSGQCGASGELRICPTGDPFQATPSPGQTPGEGGGVAIDLPQSDEVSCQITTDATACDFVLPFHVSGLPASAIYRTAIRLAETSSWTVGEAAEPAGIDTFAVPLAIPPSAASVQVAVLVFTGGADFPAGETDTLAATGADSAFVSGVLAVSTLR